MQMCVPRHRPIHDEEMDWLLRNEVKLRCERSTDLQLHASVVVGCRRIWECSKLDGNDYGTPLGRFHYRVARSADRLLSATTCESDGQNERNDSNGEEAHINTLLRRREGRGIRQAEQALTCS